MSHPAQLFNVLLVSGGGLQGLTLFKGLARAGNFRIVIADCHAENIGRYFAHRYRVVPPISDRERFLNALLEICREETIHVVFPSTEFELEFLAEHAETFAAHGIKLAVSSVDFLRLVRDKQQLYAFLRQEGLPTLDDVDVSAPEIRFPILGKPRSGWGGKGQLLLKSAEELRRHSLAELQERYVWQPWLREFVEYSVDFGISFSGKVSPVCIRERVRVSGGFAVVSKFRDDPQVSAIAERFAALAAGRGGRGMFNLQILRTGDGCFISDVNPRVGTSAVSDDSRLDLPVFVCSPELAAELQRRPRHEPVTLVRYLEEAYVETENLEGVRGVVFDLDDTLLDHKQWILQKLIGLFITHASKLPPVNEFLARAVIILEEGNRSRLIDALGEHFGLSAGLCQDLIEAYRNYCPTAVAVYADVWPLLGELRRRRYQLAILTNNPPETQRQKIRAAGFQEAFDEIVYARELQAEKPALESFVHVAGRLRLKPDELVMVGDHLYSDLIGAMDAGYRHGFLAVRPGGFYNFDVGLFEQWSGSKRRFTVMAGLRELLRHLKEPA